MPTLPQIDHGLMANHLAAHEGVLIKLMIYHANATSTKLKEILKLQIEIMNHHVDVMLAFINPNTQEIPNIKPLESFLHGRSHHDMHNSAPSFNDQWMTLEAYNTASNMAATNYTSSLMMQDPYVSHAHEEMAKQQDYIKGLYADYIKKMNWTYIPMSTKKEQENTYQFFKHI